MRLLSRIPGASRLDRYLRRHYTGHQDRDFAPYGSYYSPFPNRDDIERKAEKIFAKQRVDVGPSINLRTTEQEMLLKELAVYYHEFDWPAEKANRCRFYLDNGSFLAADALSLYGLLRHFRPQRVIAVGSGFASALMLDINERFLGGDVVFTFIERHAEHLQSLLRPNDIWRLNLVESDVRDLSINLFGSLGGGDFLFIDSSHVVKTASDVTYLLFEVLPRLADGVIVQFHDVMWPFEYPRQWIQEGRAWNEAYLLRAFLQYNDVFRILLFNNYAGYCLTELIRELMPRFLENRGGSLWLQKAF